jgi:hypothetical protein
MGALEKFKRKQAERTAEKVACVIPVGARNLSCIGFEPVQIEERFLASLGMTHNWFFFANCEVCST